MHLRLAVVTAFAVSALGCGSELFRSSSGELRASTATLDFGAVWIGHPATARLEVSNTGRSDRDVRLVATGSFTVASDLSVPGGSARAVEVTFAPQEETSYAEELTLESEGDVLRIKLTGSGKKPPLCEGAKACSISQFDPVAGACVDVALDDGTGCSTACVSAGTCSGGKCVGTLVDCDDENACTIDGCSDEKGCLSDPVTCAEPEDPCLAAVCDPVTGCGVAVVQDGIACGPSDCVTSRVCVSGMCLTRPTPEGAACGDDSPCQPKGTCSNQVCERPAPVELVPEWQHTIPIGSAIHFAGVVDEGGNHYWVECGATCELVSVAEAGTLRFRTALGSDGFYSSRDRGAVVVSDGVVVVTSGADIQGIDASSGVSRWNVSLASLFPSAGSNPLISAGALVEAAPGRLRISAALYPEVSGTHQFSTAAVFALHASTGGVEWSWFTGQVIWSLVADADGRVWFRSHAATSGGPLAMTLTALDQAGAVVFTSASPHLPLAAWDGRLVTYNGALLSTGDGSEVGQLTLPGGTSPTFGGSPPVTSRTIGFASDGWDDSEGTLFAFDPQTGAIHWTRALQDLVFAELYPRYEESSMPLVTTDDSVLFTGARGHSSRATRESRLVDVASDGSVRFNCPLPGLDGDYARPMSLHDGRLTMLRSVETPIPTRSVVSFKVLDRELADSGWVTAAGNAAGAGRPK